MAQPFIAMEQRFTEEYILHRIILSDAFFGRIKVIETKRLLHPSNHSYQCRERQFSMAIDAHTGVI